MGVIGFQYPELFASLSLDRVGRVASLALGEWARNMHSSCLGGNWAEATWTQQLLYSFRRERVPGQNHVPIRAHPVHLCGLCARPVADIARKVRADITGKP